MSSKALTINAALVPLYVGAGAFTALLPDIADIRRAKNDPALTQDVRVAEFTASAVVVTTGLGASYLVDSWFPAVVAMVIAGSLIGLYETILALDPHPKGKATS